VLTVSDVLALRVLSAGAPRIRAGEGHLDTPVRWVHVSEQVDVAGLLGGGELLLTTGMGFAAAGFEPEAYVASLAEAGVVGVVVELGDHLRELPAALVRAAREEGLPLVELHRVVRFVEVTEQVHGRLLHDQYTRLEFADRVHGTFAALSLADTTAEEVLRRAAALVEGPVVLEDLGHRVLAHVPAPLTSADLLVDWPRRSRREADLEDWVVVPAGVPGDRWGRLVAPGPRSAQDAGLVLERAAEILSVLRLVHAEDLVARAHDDLLRELLQSRTVDEPALRQRLRSLGVSTRGGFLAVAVAGADREQVAAALSGLQGRSLIGMIGDEDGPLVGVLLVGPPAGLEGVAARLASALAQTTVGASSVLSELGAVGAGFGEARHVARVAATLPHRRPGTVHRTGDLGVRGLLWRLRDDPRLTGFAEAQLATVLDSPDDLGLLTAYLDLNGSMTKLAQRLHLSRPATYGRVERLSRRLGRDLDDPEVRTALHVAVLAINGLRSPGA